jgi:hypothetical protein
VLRPGGLLFLATPNRYTLGLEPHVRLWGVGYLPAQLPSATCNAPAASRTTTSTCSSARRLRRSARRRRLRDDDRRPRGARSVAADVPRNRAPASFAPTTAPAASASLHATLLAVGPSSTSLPGSAA